MPNGPEGYQPTPKEIQGAQAPKSPDVLRPATSVLPRQEVHPSRPYHLEPAIPRIDPAHQPTGERTENLTKPAHFKTELVDASQGVQNPRIESDIQKIKDKPIEEKIEYLRGLNVSSLERAKVAIELEVPTAGGAAEASRREGQLSLERLREVVEAIVELEAKPYEEKYNDENEGVLKSYYQQLEGHVATTGWRKPSERELEKEEKKPAEDSRVSRQNSQESSQQSSQELHPEPALVSESIQDLYSEYHRSGPEDRDQIKKEISDYFAVARNRGLFRRIDPILSSIAEQDLPIAIKRRFTSDQFWEAIGPRIQFAIQRGDESLNELIFQNPENRKLEGVVRTYLELARLRFMDVLEKRDISALNLPPESPYDFEGQFMPQKEADIEEVEEDSEDLMIPKERFWKKSYYYEVTAETPQEFLIAKDTYIEWAQSGAISKAPERQFREMDQFREALTNACLNAHISTEFTENLVRGLESRISIYGADYSNEHYHASHYKEFMNFLGEHEGPDRWLALAREIDGKVAAALWKLDNDPKFELYFSSHGSRGQLGGNSNAQWFLQKQIKEIMIEELMDIEIKEGRLEYVTSHQPEDEFKNLYEGFDGDYYEVMYTKPDGQLTESERQIRNDLRSKFDQYDKLSPEEKKELEPLKKSLEIGRIKKELKDGKKLKDLTSEDRRAYMESKSRARAAFDIAFQMYGAMGEKSKRGGGVLLVDKIDKKGNKIVDWVPSHWAEKFVQFAETWTKTEYGRTQPNMSARDLEKKVLLARGNAVMEIKEKGFEAIHYEDVLKDGKPAKMEIYEADRDENGQVKKDTKGKAILKPVEADFNNSVRHIYSRWTSHTYWGYQEELRHMLLDPKTHEAAIRIRDGESLPGDEREAASQLLIIDPTLSRIDRFPDMWERERKLILAAVEDSYQSHWRIRRSLYRQFYPGNDGDPSKIRINFGLQDYGGFRKTVEHIVAKTAQEQDKFARVLKLLIPEMPVHYASMAEMWGQNGAMGVINMLEEQPYRLVGEFALLKHANQALVADKLRASLVTDVNEQRGVSEEGVYEKPLSRSDKLQAFVGSDSDIYNKRDVEARFIDGSLEALKRVETTLDHMRVLEGDIRGGQDALWLEGINIFINPADVGKPPKEQRYLAPDKNGVFNPYIDTIQDTGSSRHSGKIFFDKFMRWLRTDGIRSGMVSYGEESSLIAFWDGDYRPDRDANEWRRKNGVPLERVRSRADRMWQIIGR
jgi:hypothetical protein